MATREEILGALGTIMDPDLGRDIVSLGFVKDLRIEGGAVSFALELTTPACPMKQKFKGDCEAAVGALDGVTSVSVTLTAKPQGKPGGAPDNTLRQVDAIVAVSSCKGGVGKSTIAVHLARALQREGKRVGLLDADVYGPSFPTLFNLNKPDIFVVEGKIVPLDIDGMKVMSMGFVLGDAPAVMRGPMVSNYISQILTQTDWGALDFLIIDMPPGTGDVQLTVTQAAALEGAVIVTTPQALSLVDVARGILMFEKVDVPVLGIVENMSYFECDGCGKKHYIFGSSAHTLKERFGLSSLAEIPIIDGFSDLANVDAGKDLEPIRDLAKNLQKALCERRAGAVAQPKVTFDSNAVHIEWPDGAKDSIANFKLRASCQCATCVDEHTGEQKLDVAQIPPDIHPEEVHPLGNYALSIAWSDGHGSGIFSWSYLKYLAGE